MSLFSSYKILVEYRQDPLAFFQKMFRENGHQTYLEVLGRKMIILSHPEDVMHVLKINHQSYTKGRTTRAIKTFLGNGLITSEGDEWRLQHRLIRPVMNPKSIHELAPKMQATTEQFLNELVTDQPINSFHEMNRLTWRIVLNTLFSQEATKELDSWLDDVLYLMESITTRTRSAIKIPYFIPTSTHRRVKGIVDKFGNYIYRLLEERRQGEKRNDLLQLLIDIRDDSSKGMTDEVIKDQVLTFLMAGHETVTNTLSWFLITLAQNQKYLPRLQEEAAQFFKTMDYQALNASPWSTAVIDEVMRLWPPVWAFMRRAEKEDKVGEMIIPRKANVVLSPYLSHRAPDLWERPDDFFPERFMTDRKKISPGAFYPFGYGPRACIGGYFAGMEAKIILANLVHNFNWSIVDQSEQAYESGITLRPTNNISMIFKRR